MTPTPAPPDRTTFTARTPEDVLAVVPVVMGFHPEESVAMLTFGAPGSFHGRVDLPRTRADDDVVIASLVDPARRHRVKFVVLVFYTDDASTADRIARRLVRELVRHGIGVAECLRAHGGRWYAAGTRIEGVPAWGVPYDVSNHRFLAQSVVAGLVTHGSRSELAASLDTDPTRTASLAAAVRTAELEGDWCTPERASATVTRHLEAETIPDGDLAPLLLGMLDLTVRDAAWAPMTRADAAHHVAMWTDAVRRAPRDLVPAAAAVLGFAAWLSGQGALAWLAVDRCREVEPENSLAQLVADALQHAVPPAGWHESWVAHQLEDGGAPGGAFGDQETA